MRSFIYSSARCDFFSIPAKWALGTGTYKYATSANKEAILGNGKVTGISPKVQIPGNALEETMISAELKKKFRERGLAQPSKRSGTKAR